MTFAVIVVMIVTVLMGMLVVMTVRMAVLMAMLVIAAVRYDISVFVCQHMHMFFLLFFDPSGKLLFQYNTKSHGEKAIWGDIFIISFSDSFWKYIRYA